MSVLSLFFFIFIYQVETSGGHGSYGSKGGRQVGQTRAGLSSSSCPVQLENSFSSKSQKKLDGSDPTRKGGVLWLTSALNVFIQFALQLPENVVVEKGRGEERGESDSRLLSITGRKDKNLLSLCQHSSAQRDFIDQRTAMQEPLLHPTDTIYHAPLFPSLPSFHHTGLSVHPIMQKRHTQKKTSSKKRDSFWCK